MSQQQRDAIDQPLRDAPLDLGGDVAGQRVIFEKMMAAIPLPADVTTSSGDRVSAEPTAANPCK